MIVNFGPGRIMTVFDEMVKWIADNPDSTRWVQGKPMIIENGVIYVSAIEFDNTDDCAYCMLKYGLERTEI